MVVLVYVLLEALAAGVEQVGANTGDPRNLLITRRGATAETTSQVTVEQARLLKYFEEIAKDENNNPLLSTDLLIVINLPREDGTANVQMRAVSSAGVTLRPQVKLTQGRWFVPGKREVIASEKMARRFPGLRLGANFATSGATFEVVGLFDGDGSAFDSEVWLDADEARAIFDRANYSSLLLRPVDERAHAALIERIENDKRLKLRVESEVKYYQSQTTTAAPLKVLGGFLASTMSIGACFAAMNTMYASVAARTREIGTLRVLGFRRFAVMAGFLVEGMCLAALGGAVGCGLSFFAQPLMAMSGASLGTLNIDTFSETILEFAVTPAVALKGMIFSVLIGLIGSFLPALRASRLPVISALRSI